VTDYTPVLPGGTFTFTSGGWVAAGDPVELSGPMQVDRAHTGPGQGLYVGVAGNDAGGRERVTVHVAAVIHRGRCQGDATWGQPLTVGDAPLTPPGTAPFMVRPVVDVPGSQAIGIALDSAPDGGQIQWMSLELGLPDAGFGGGLWATTAGNPLPAWCLVEINPNINAVVPSGPGSVFVIGTVYEPAAGGQPVVVHLAGPLLHTTAWEAFPLPGDLVVSSTGGTVRRATPGDISTNPRRVLGISMNAAGTGEVVHWVARH
jgi:hypothetical protein